METNESVGCRKFGETMSECSCGGRYVPYMEVPFGGDLEEHLRSTNCPVHRPGVSMNAPEKMTPELARLIIANGIGEWGLQDRPTREMVCEAKGFLSGWDARSESVRDLVEALEKTLSALAGYKRYVPEPYKISPIYIMGSHEAEKLAVAALSSFHSKESEGKKP